MTKITKLTKEQEEYLPIFRDEYLKHGLSCDPVNKEEIIPLMAEAYSFINEKAPYVWVVDSPMQANLILNILHNNELKKVNLRVNLWANLRVNLWANIRNNLGANLWDNLWDNLSDNLKVNLKDNLEDNLDDNLADNLAANLKVNLKDNLRVNLWANIRNNLGANLWDNLSDNLEDNLWDNLADKLRDNLWANIRNNLGANLWDNLEYYSTWNWGQHDLYWIAFYKFCQKIGVPYSKEDSAKLDLQDRIGKSMMWWWPYKNMVIVSDRPKLIKKDQDGRLHCENGPAIEFRDGYKVFSWRGINVPEQWIMTPDQVDPADIIKCTDVEKRAAGASIIGWPRMLKVLQHKVIDDSGNPDIGQLIELTLPGLPKPGRFLKAECPRNGTICEGVPYVSDVDDLPIQTALHAQAWRIGDPLSDYQHPTQRT
jgi:hypothetical protein